MKHKVTLKVEVVVSTNRNELESCGLMADEKRFVASHIKNCLLDNPDVDIYSVDDVDVSVVQSEEIEE